MSLLGHFSEGCGEVGNSSVFQIRKYLVGLSILAEFVNDIISIRVGHLLGAPQVDEGKSRYHCR
jgi:hypothetical protein